MISWSFIPMRLSWDGVVLKGHGAIDERREPWFLSTDCSDNLLNASIRAQPHQAMPSNPSAKHEGTLNPPANSGLNQSGKETKIRLCVLPGVRLLLLLAWIRSSPPASVG